MTESLSILNIGGHPKDAILYAGGTMARHVERGDKVTILSATTGMSHHLQAIDDYRDSGDLPDIDALIAERKQELINAAAELGVTDVRYLGHDDQVVLPNAQMVNDIADVIGEIQPNIIVTHWPYDTVAAHALATQMTLLAIEAASTIRPGSPYAPTGGDTGGESAQLFYHVQLGRTNVLEQLNLRVPNTIIDITSTFLKKSAAMNQFKSQHYGEDSLQQRKLGETIDGGMSAIHSRVTYAESFIAHNPEVYEFLPVSDYRRNLTNRSPEDQEKSRNQMLLVD